MPCYPVVFNEADTTIRKKYNLPNYSEYVRTDGKGSFWFDSAADPKVYKQFEKDMEKYALDSILIAASAQKRAATPINSYGKSTSSLLISSSLHYFLAGMFPFEAMLDGISKNFGNLSVCIVVEEIQDHLERKYGAKR